MPSEDISQIFSQAQKSLSDFSEMEKKGFFHDCHNSDLIPSSAKLERIIDLCRSIFFPGYYGENNTNRQFLKGAIKKKLEFLYLLLTEQIEAGLNFCQHPDRAQCPMQAEDISAHMISLMPELRALLQDDVIATYNNDPATTEVGEIISCYPVIKAMMNYRFAHELFKLNVPIIPRIITEMAHSETGIDIHPGAEIGRHFTIDHGTGVVIGATTIIGNNVKLYQGVTLGSRSFPLDADGNPIKGIPRHPILEDDVIIYSNATILGRITIGKGAVIGGNIWITENVPPGTKVVQYRK